MSDVTERRYIDVDIRTTSANATRAGPSFLCVLFEVIKVFDERWGSICGFIQALGKTKLRCGHKRLEKEYTISFAQRVSCFVFRALCSAVIGLM